MQKVNKISVMIIADNNIAPVMIIQSTGYDSAKSKQNWGLRSSNNNKLHMHLAWHKYSWLHFVLRWQP